MNRYTKIIESIFFKYYNEGKEEVLFERIDIEQTASELKIKLPKNLGDVLYSFRYRNDLPESITKLSPEGYEWIIRPAGRSKYKFVLSSFSNVTPSLNLLQIKIPDATPGVIDKYALNDEQALLAKLRYNRLIDIFTGLACYSLQNHLRTTVKDMGQVETDELYIGIDKNGAHYVIPVQAKGGSDKIGVVQIEQDISICKNKFPDLIHRPLAAQFIKNNLIAIFEFIESDDGIKIINEKQYQLVKPDELTDEEIKRYKKISTSKE